MQCATIHRRLVRMIMATLLMASMLGACAQHAYLAGTPSAGKADFSRLSDDWFPAARAGRTDILQALIEANFPLETKTPEGYTPLILSSYDQPPEPLNFL